MTNKTLADVMVVEAHTLVENIYWVRDRVISHALLIDTCNSDFHHYSFCDIESTISMRLVCNNQDPQSHERSTAYNSLQTHPDLIAIQSAAVLWRLAAVRQAMSELLEVTFNEKNLSEWSHYCARVPELQTLDEYLDAQHFLAIKGTFDTPPEKCIPVLGLPAAAVRESYEREHSFKATTPLWEVRENQRMRTSYTPLPSEVLQHLPDTAKAMFPHIATKPGNEGLIAFTQSPMTGELDRQQVMKPGRFIRQHCTALSDETVKQLTAAVASEVNIQFVHTRDEMEIAQVYMRGPSSCMSGNKHAKHFDRLIVDGEFFHPTRVYAHPHNQIELVWLNFKDRPAARALINTSTKTYPRVYGSDAMRDARIKLCDYLHGLGYTESCDALQGQIIQRVSPDDFPDAIICPYIDSGNLGVYVHSDHLVIGGSNDDCDSESDHETGCLNGWNTEEAEEYDWHCSDCGEGQNSDDDSYEVLEGGSVCRSCADEYTECYCVSRGHSICVPSNSSDIYSAAHLNRGSLRYYDHVLVEDMSDASSEGWVVLHESYDSGSMSAFAYEECTVADENGESYLTDDLSSMDMFIDEEDGVARNIEDWAIVDGQLTERSLLDLDTSEVVEVPTDTQYPMLPHYQTVCETDQETAA